MEPTQLGPYRLGRQLGRGGMGTVYAGQNVETGERAAVKILAVRLAGDEGFRDRFVGEIETLKKLRHPNIVQLFGWGEEEGHLFYAMELVDGTNLEQELARRKRFDWREVAQLGISLARALKHAHDRGVIHRDLKPANLLLSFDGTLKLSDFGIAKLFGSTGMTIDGGVLGTAEYMSPEQSEGRPVTSRCDLYSVGGVLYALLAGRPPFQARSLPEMLQLQRFAVPEPIGRLAPDVPAELEQIIGQLLEKDPERRIPSALVLARRLESIAQALSGPRPDTQTEMKATVEGFVLEDDTAPSGATPGSPTRLAPLDSLSATNVDPVSQARLAAGTRDLGYSLAAEPSALDRAAAPDRGQVTSDPSRPAAAGLDTARPNPPDTRPPSARFTTLAEAEAAHPNAAAAYAPPWAQIAALAGALVLIAAAVMYFSRPQTAEGLYSSILSAAEQSDRARLVEAEPQLEEFLERFPGDPRAAQVKAYRQEAELYVLERKLKMQSRFNAGGAPPAPIEQAYLQASRAADEAPSRGLQSFQALMVLFSDDPDSVVQQYVELARRRIGELEAAQQVASQSGKAFLEEQLARAASLPPERIDEARAIWQAILELFSDQPYAAGAADVARRCLDDSKPVLPAANGSTTVPAFPRDTSPGETESQSP